MNGTKASEIAPIPVKRRKDLSRDPKMLGEANIPANTGPTTPPPIIPKPQTMEFARVTPPFGAIKPVRPKKSGNPVYENIPNRAKLVSVSQKLVELSDKSKTDNTQPRLVTPIMFRRPNLSDNDPNSG
jgi:hypothetical protein